MRIGILGHGAIGGSLARLWASAGHEVMVAGRSIERAQAFADGAGHGIRAGQAIEAVRFGDAVLIAVRWTDLHVALAGGVAEAFAGRIAIDATNDYGGGQMPTAAGLTHSETVARALPGARVVKAFNMMRAGVIVEIANGAGAQGLAILVSGDDADAKAIVSALVADARFVAVDAGPLAAGALFERDAPLYDVQISPAEARARLANTLHSTA